MNRQLNPYLYLFLGFAYLAFAGLSIYFLRYSMDWAPNILIGFIASIVMFLIAWDARNVNRELAELAENKEHRQ